MKTSPFPPLFCALVLVVPIGCHGSRTERDIHTLELPIVSKGEIFIGKIEFDSDTPLGAGRALWIHRLDRDSGQRHEIRTDLASSETLGKVRRGIREQLRASGYSIPQNPEESPLLLDVEIIDLELLTERTRRTGITGSRSAIVSLRFLLRASSDQALMARAVRNEWVLFSGHDVAIEGGRPHFRSNDPDPIVLSVRFALREFLNALVSQSKP